MRKWLPTIVAVAALGIHLIAIGNMVGDITARIESLEKHAENQMVHMPFKEKIEVFITRREAEKADDEIKSKLSTIESKIDFLYQQAQRTAQR